MKKSLAVIAVMALFICPNADFALAANQNSDVETSSLTYTSQASNRYMRKDISGAIECLNEAIKINPNNPMLYLNRGFIKHVTHDYDGAMQDYNQALKVNPQFASAYNNRGVLKVAINDISGAFQDYETALNLNNKYSDVYYNRGNLKYMTDDLKGALDDYDKAIEYNPHDSEAYNNRGVVKKRLNYNVGALSDYSQAIALNPKDSIAYANRGRLKKLYFDNEGAAIDLDQAIALAENQEFIKNVKPLLSNQNYIAALPSSTSFAYDITDDYKNINTSTDKNLYSADNESENTKLAIAVSPAINKIQENLSKEKPLQELVSPKNTKPAVNVKTVKHNNNTPTLNAGVGKVVSPDIPDIRTTPVKNDATTNVKLAESYYIRGLQKCVLKDLQGAIVDLDKAIANNSKYAEAYLYRAAIKKELGDKEGFRKDYATAIQLDSKLQTYNDYDTISMISG